jgi:archaemetzincin
VGFGDGRRRWATRVAWLLPWIVTVALALGLHASPRPEPARDGGLLLEVSPHELIAHEVIEAVGPLEHLPPATRKAFEYTSHFSPIPTPSPDDWLRVHPERGQTVLDYLASHPNRPEPPRDHIYVLPLGELPAERGPTLEELRAHASAYFGLPVSVLPVRSLAELDVPERMHEGHRQLDASAVLDRIHKELPHDAYCLIAVTLEDLWPGGEFSYVFGYARLHARVGVFSFARYHPDFFGESFAVDRKVVLQRALKVMSHELGHMFGLEHCIHLHCIMNGANHLSELDRAPLHLCPVCLRKLHVALGFDAQARDQALAEHYARLGLHEAADWSRQRGAYLRREAAR